METVLNTITIDAAQLRGALAIAPVERSTTFPVLTSVCLQPYGAFIRALSTDLDVHAVTDMDGTAANDKPILIPQRKVLDILKGESGLVTIAYRETVTMATVRKPGKYENGQWIEGAEVEEENKEHAVTLGVGGINYEFPAMDVCNFPQFPDEIEPAASMDGAQFREMLAHTMAAIPKEQSRYVLNGILFEMASAETTLCATDGHRLAIETRNAGLSWRKQFTETTSAVIPTSCVNWLYKNLGKTEIDVAIRENDVIFSLPNVRTVFTARTLNGQFPNYEAVMPKAEAIIITARFDSSDSLTKTLAKVAKMADDRSHAVKWAMNGTCVISAQSYESGKAQATIPSTIEHTESTPEVTIGLNSDYVLDVLKIAGKGALSIALKDSQSAALVKVEAFPGFAYVLMPMRI